MNRKLTEILKYNGYSLTTARRSVFRVLDNENKPMNMGELVKQLKDEIDRVTVYRTIELYQKIGIVSRIQVGWKYKLELSDKFKNHHHHITCKVCGKIEDFIETPGLILELERISGSNQFKLITHSLELNGICSKCQEKNNLNNA